MEEIKKYVEENKERFLNELFELIRIPSISSLSEHKPDMYRCAEQWTKIMLAAGADRAEVYETEGNPVAYGEKIIDPALPTVLVYGHMDVMPVDPIELWNTKPFEPVIKDGKIWARGADDDKGQAFMHAKAFEYLMKSGKLNCNVKFMIEGEEEIGSPSLPKFCRDHKDMLKADVILVSGGAEMAQLFLEGEAYQDLSAVQNGHVYGVDADMSNRPGPRIVDSLGEFVTAINDALAAEEA